LAVVGIPVGLSPDGMLVRFVGSDVK
jgi:hypothetical protein